MSIWLYVQCILMFLLGQGIDLFLIKIPEFRKLFKNANQEFVWKKYWKGDWNVIIGTQMVGAIFLIGLSELANWKPLIMDYVKWFFAAIGGFGSSIIISKWSQTRKFIMNVINVKTDVADDKTNNQNQDKQ